MFCGTKKIEPVVCWLTVNRRCNLRCKWCYAEGAGYHGDDMSLELAQGLTILAQAMGIKKILLIGGEPTLWDPIFDFNRFCRARNLQTVIITNGIHFGNDGFWERYIKDPNDHVGLSLKARSPDQLQEVAQSTSFGQMEKGMKRAVSQLKAQIAITYNTFYCGNLLEMAQFAIDCGSPGVKIDFCSTTFTDNVPNSSFMVPPKELAANIVRDYPGLVQITSGRLVLELMLPFCLFPSEFIEDLKAKKQISSVCHVKKGKGLIWDEHGNLLMCNALFGYPIGSYKKDFATADSLREWLDNPTITEYYNRIGSYPSVLCQSCRLYQDCGGGCPLRWAVYDPKTLITPFQ